MDGWAEIGGRELFILLAEDDENDAHLMTRAFQKCGITRFHVVRDGQEAINYLCAKKQYSDREKYPFPVIFLTDLKMPRVGGLDVLRWIREHEHCGVIPTIILSTSRQDSDVKLAYELGANSYLQKPTTFDELKEMLNVLL